METPFSTVTQHLTPETEMNENTVFKGFTFDELAAQIDSQPDPFVKEKLRHLRNNNIFLGQTVLGKDKFIPVGSSVDGSKVNTPNDPGDLDILIIAGDVKLNEELFEYDSVYPAFLHIKNKGVHQKIFAKSKLPPELYHVPVKALKGMDCLHGAAKFFLQAMFSEGLNENILKLNRNSAVGVEESRLGSKPLHDIGVSDECLQTNSKWKIGMMAYCGKQVLERLHNMPASLHELLKTTTDIEETCVKLVPNIPEPVNQVANVLLDFLLREQEPPSGKTGSSDATDRHEQSKDILQNRDDERELIFDNDLNKLTSTCRIRNLSKSFQGNLNECQQAQADSSTKVNKNVKVRKSTTVMNLNRHGSIDYVFALQFEGWPRAAEEWLYRKRCWPPNWVIDNSLNVGCQVVAKRPFALCNSLETNDDEDTYFRLSFALVEIKLAKSMNKVQIRCWRVLKAYQKTFLQSKPRVLTSYLWKNVLFWICERCNISHWKNANLLDRVIQCLDFMSDCLQTGVLPFYFVPGMNLLNGCRVDTMTEVNRKLQFIRQNPGRFLYKFLTNPPDSEQFQVDLKDVENKMSYSETAERHKKNVDRMVDAVFLDGLPTLVNLDPNVFIDEWFDVKTKMFSTMRDNAEKKKKKANRNHGKENTQPKEVSKKLNPIQETLLSVFDLGASYVKNTFFSELKPENQRDETDEIKPSDFELD